MNKVILNKMDTCLSYVLKRIGCFELYPFDYDKLVDGEWFEIFAYKKENLEIGDVSLWDEFNGVKRALMSTEITEDGKLIFNKVYQGFHCAVYEGDGLYSDCSQDGFYPYLRVHRIDKIRADKILRKRHNLNILARY